MVWKYTREAPAEKGRNKRKTENRVMIQKERRARHMSRTRATLSLQVRREPFDVAILDCLSKLLPSIVQSTRPLSKCKFALNHVSPSFATTDHQPASRRLSRHHRSTGEGQEESRKLAGSLDEYQKSTMNGFSLHN